MHRANECPAPATDHAVTNFSTHKISPELFRKLWLPEISRGLYIPRQLRVNDSPIAHESNVQFQSSNVSAKRLLHSWFVVRHLIMPTFTTAQLAQDLGANLSVTVPFKSRASRQPIVRKLDT